MYRTTVPVGATEGLHSRPAGTIAELAESFAVEITLAVAGRPPVDAASPVLVMSLGAGHGTLVTVSSEDAEAVAEVAALIARDLDEE